MIDNSDILKNGPKEIHKSAMDRLFKEEIELKKAAEEFIEKGKNMPEGTVEELNGIKLIKSEGVWVPHTETTEEIEKAKKKLDPEGRWVTIDGRHVHLSSGGKVDAGKIYGTDNKDSKDHTTKNGGKNYKDSKEAQGSLFSEKEQNPKTAIGEERKKKVEETKKYIDKHLSGDEQRNVKEQWEEGGKKGSLEDHLIKEAKDNDSNFKNEVKKKTKSIEFILDGNLKYVNELIERRDKFSKKTPEDFKETNGGTGRTKKEILTDFDNSIKEFQDKNISSLKELYKQDSSAFMNKMMSLKDSNPIKKIVSDWVGKEHDKKADEYTKKKSEIKKAYETLGIEKANKLPGGKADKHTVESIAKKHGVEVEQINSQLKMGLEVEKEHTTDKEKSKEVAMDHLVESPTYYTDLKKMEEESGNKKEIKKALETLGLGGLIAG